jgi:uncharacterized protein (TIGR03382 family)
LIALPSHYTQTLIGAFGLDPHGSAGASLGLVGLMAGLLLRRRRRAGR